jgi:hypothetical protein
LLYFALAQSNNADVKMEDNSDAYKLCCERLERNDPSLVEVSLSLSHPAQHLCRVSESLPKSSFVASLKFDVAETFNHRIAQSNLKSEACTKVFERDKTGQECCFHVQ